MHAVDSINIIEFAVGSINRKRPPSYDSLWKNNRKQPPRGEENTKFVAFASGAKTSKPRPRMFVLQIFVPPVLGILYPISQKRISLWEKGAPRFRAALPGIRITLFYFFAAAIAFAIAALPVVSQSASICFTVFVPVRYA